MSNPLLGFLSWAASCFSATPERGRSVRPRLTASEAKGRDQKRRRRKQAKASRRKNR